MAAREKTSKRQSVAKSLPQPSYVSFLDKNLGRYDVRDALRAAGYSVEVLTDHFAENTPDTVWLPAVGRRKWIILTKDKMVRRRPLELRALWSSGVPSFVLRSGDTTGPENAQAILNAMPAMHELIQRKPWPFIATITKSGAVAVLLAQGQLYKHL